MKPYQLAKFAAVVLALAGVAALVAAGVVSTQSFQARGGAGSRVFDCGSVLFAKDPRNLVPKNVEAPLNYRRGYSNCETLRSDRTHKALTFMLVGAAPLLLVLALPALSRRSHRARARRRVRM